MQVNLTSVQGVDPNRSGRDFYRMASSEATGIPHQGRPGGLASAHDPGRFALLQAAQGRSQRVDREQTILHEVKLLQHREIAGGEHSSQR